MDSTQLERTALETKDRDELTTIATALGGKPGSRSRKAEIVDLILDLAGVDGAPSAGSANGSAPAAEALTEEPPAAWEAAAEAEEKADKADKAESKEAASDRTARDGRDQQKPKQESQNRDGDRRGGSQNQSRNRQQDQAGPGNRRRRRSGGRGRERDNTPEEPWDGEPVAIEGYIDLRDEGYGFLRVNGFKPSKDDAYVSVKQVRQFDLRKGDHLTGTSRPANRSEKNPALLSIESVNGRPPEEAKGRPRFEDLTPLFPDERLRLEVEGDSDNMTARIVDLISPIGKGQRGLIVSPPKAGKTTIMKTIARSIETNHPEVKLIVLLVDERPEEVTDMRRWLKNGEVMGSTFDRPSDEHTHLAEIAIERAKRMVERGEDVVIMLDGITRLSRAYNLAAPATGRIMSGGIDTGALYPPKKFFGAARNVEEGGSLTILATALVETGSKMDEVIFEEFKGTGNMELRLDRRIAERRVYPAIDVNASSTRHEELLFERKQLNQVWKLRRVLNGLANDGDTSAAASLELLIDRLKTFKNNDEFLAEVAKGPSMGS
ncbi:MAG: transcription termination factor Rho [Acidimicrobiales bacterium]|jgi:transcription termination factor Rho|nr:transcription termination factor Rho [Acidimicrobiales bacterium]HJO99911.1 transcription termination factor Rho [Acidimicrobiales bacterium]|tara:strand:- start:2223 stop:3869 length:1647 start_codon:yes stop_codon:yes gene_type:complete